MAYIRKLPSGRWQATVRLPDGRRRARTDPLKATVRRWAADLESSGRSGEWADPRDGRITLGAWYETWSSTRIIESATRARDASHWRSHVEPRWGEVPISAVTAWDVESWLADMVRAKVGASSAQQSARLLRHMLSDAVRHRLIPVDPMTHVRIPTPPKHVDRFLNSPELERLLDALPTERDRAFVMLLAMCGLRWGEAAGLHAHRVDLERGVLTVVEVSQRIGAQYKGRPKSDAGQRDVPFTARVGDALTPLVEAAYPNGPLFPGMGYSTWRRRVFVPAVVEAHLALPHPTPHDLRHTYGSWLADCGVPVHDIMALMGHSTLRATERYLHSSVTRFDLARAAMSPRAIGS